MFLKQKQEENAVKEDKNYYIVDKAVLPEIFLKVMDVKNLLESKKEKTVQGQRCHQSRRHQPQCVL